MSNTSQKTFNGQCLCGGVRFSASGTFDELNACHCTQCARWTGSYFVSATIKKADLEFTSNDTLKWFTSSQVGRRGFCSKCGASLFWEHVGADEIDILPGSLDQPTGLKITDHIFVADKSDYYEINDDAPQYPQHRTSK